MQRAGHAAHRHPAGAVRGDARRLRSGRAAARPSTAALAARPEPATIHNTLISYWLQRLQCLDLDLDGRNTDCFLV